MDHGDYAGGSDLFEVRKVLPVRNIDAGRMITHLSFRFSKPRRASRPNRFSRSTGVIRCSMMTLCRSNSNCWCHAAAHAA